MGDTNYTNKAIIEKDEACSLALTMACGSVQPMVLRAAIELNILEILKRAGPEAQLSANEIVTQLPTSNPSSGPMLDRILRLLASYKILSCSVQTLPNGRVEWLYGHTPICQFLTKGEDEPSLDAFCLLVQDKVTTEIWYHLKDAILDGGIAMEKAFGKVLYDYQKVDERYNKLFNTAMANYADIVANKILETYKGFEGLSSLVDLGGGIGTLLNRIVLKYPTIKGINFDLPHVVKDAPSFKGMEHVGGDMFVSIPKADAIFMKWVLGDWRDDDCVKLLKSCYDAILPNKNGKVIVCEYIVPDNPETIDSTKAVFLIDVLRMAHEIAGRERTEQEYRTMATRAGFKGFKVSCSVYDFKLIELIKN